MLSPVALLLLLGVVLALPLLIALFIVPLIPMRRQRAGIAGVPFVTIGLLVANFLFFLLTMDNGTLSQDAGRQWGLIPRAASVLTLITHMYLHGDWFHLFGNMLGLWLFGPHVEEALGRVEYFIFYVGCGIAGGLLHLLVASTFTPEAATIPMVGASGAISGILGLFVVRFWRTQGRLFLVFQVPAIWPVLLYMIAQLFLGIYLTASQTTAGVAYWAHIGGFLFGALMAYPLRMREDSHREYLVEDAAKAAALGNNDQAASYYRQILQQTPEDADAHHSLARVYIALRQAEAAHRHLRDAIQCHLKGGHSLAVARVYEDAVTCFEAFPLSPTLLQRVASACEETGHYNLTVRALSELCRDYPQAREAEMSLLRLGKLHLYKLNQPQNAEGIFSEFLRLYPDSDWHHHAARLRDEARLASQGFSPLPGVPRPAPGP